MNKGREAPILIVKKRSPAHAHHGGAWKVAFADFMTAMFALFLVLWLVNQSSDVKSAIAGYFQDPLGRANEFGSSIMPGEGAQMQVLRPLAPPQVVDLRVDRLQRLAEHIRDRLNKIPTLEAIADHVELLLVNEGLKIQLLEDSTGVFFEKGRANPSPQGQSLLALLGTELAVQPNHIVIEGHTDARPYGGGLYTNWELSADRANTARRILMGAGFPVLQIDQVRGLADRTLRVPDDPFAPSNRRVTITVLLGPRSSADSAAAPADSTTADTLPAGPSVQQVSDTTQPGAPSDGKE